jgi:hypothetical protein
MAVEAKDSRNEEVSLALCTPRAPTTLPAPAAGETMVYRSANSGLSDSLRTVVTDSVVAMAGCLSDAPRRTAGRSP